MRENTETAIFAAGCFWPAQELLRHRDGVFDPTRTSYRDILEFFLQIHRPDLGEGVVGSDYRSEIVYTSNEQRQVAEATIADADASGLWPGKVVTKMSAAGPFWEAEAAIG
jgi:peptide-methionine (S)-S-oxide reductase